MLTPALFYISEHDEGPKGTSSPSRARLHRGSQKHHCATGFEGYTHYSEWPKVADAVIEALRLTFRTLFRTSEAILEEPPVEGGPGAIYRLFHAL